MPISSTTRKAVAPCNGSTKTFPFAFKVFEESDLRVVLTNPSGVESDLTLLANYTVSLNANQDVNPGGTVTTLLAYADDYKIAVVSAVPELQPIDIVNQGGFYPEVLNEGLDRNTILTQQLSEQVARSLKLPVSAAPGDFTLPTPSGYQVLAWNNDGTGLVNLNPGELISVVTYGNTKANTFDGDGATTNFTLTDSPGSVNNLAISIDGVVQVPGTDYTWGGGTSLAFVVAPPAGTKIFVRYQEALDEGTDISGKLNKTGDNVGDDTAKELLRTNIDAAGKALRTATYVHLLDVVPKTLWAALQSPASDPTDMTPYILTAAALIPNGGVIRCDGLFLRLRTQCVLPPNVFLWGGESCPDEPNYPVTAADYTTKAPQLLYDEATDYGELGVVLRVGYGSSGYSGFTVRPYTFTPRYATRGALEAGIAAHFTKTFSNHVASGGHVHHNLYLGCDVGHHVYNIERAKVHDNRGDCNTVVLGETMTDWAQLQNNHAWPFAAAHQEVAGISDAKTWRRNGPGHTLWDVADWTQCFRPVSFGHQYGIDVRNSDNTSVLHFGIDDAAFLVSDPTWFAANPTQGVRYTGDIRRASLMDGMISSQTFGVALDYNANFSDTVHATNVRIGASRNYSYLLIHGNFTSVNGSSYCFPGIGTEQTHISLGADFGSVAFIGHTFEDGTDIVAATLADAREVQLVGCAFKDMDLQKFYTQQMQGALYVRGDDTSKGGKNQAAVIIENRTAATGTATGQAYSLLVGDNGLLNLIDVSDGRVIFTVSPTTGEVTVSQGRMRLTASVGNDAWFGVNGGSEPGNLAFGARVSATGVVDAPLANGKHGARNLIGETIKRDFAGAGLIVHTDYGTVLRSISTTDVNVELPADAEPGDQVKVIQGDTGKLTFICASGLVNGFGGVKSAGPYAIITAICYANANGTSQARWYLDGPLI